MPRQFIKSVKSQKPVKEQDSFDFTAPRIKVSARPVDAYVARPQDRSAENVLRFVDKLNNIGHGASRLSQIQQKKDRQAGSTAALKGEAPPEDSNFAFIQGHERTSGEAAAFQYRKDIEQLYMENWAMAPDEWEAAKEEINQKYLKGATDAYIQGFVPAAIQIESGVDRKYQERQLKIVQDEFLTNVGQSSVNRLYRSMETEGMTAQQRASAMRATLSAMQTAGKRYGLDRTQVSKQMITAIGEQAVRSGRPDLLGFALEPDKHGMKLISRPELATQVHSYLRQAIAKRDALEGERIRLDKKAKADAVESIEKEIVVGLNNNDLQGAEDELNKHIDLLSSEKVDNYMKRILALRSDEGWREDSDVDSYREMFDKAVAGELSDADWEVAKTSLSRKDYIKISEISSRAVEAGKDGSNSVSSTIKEYKSMLRRSIAPKNPLGELINPSNAKREEWAIHHYNLRIAEFMSSNTQPPTLDDLYKIMDTVRIEAFKEHPSYDPLGGDDYQPSGGGKNSGSRAMNGKDTEDSKRKKRLEMLKSAREKE